MLKQRLLTAAILLPVVLWAVLFAPKTLFFAALGVILLLGFWEWLNIAGVSHLYYKAVYMLILLVALLFLPADVAKPMVFVAVVLWCSAAVALARYPRLLVLWHYRPVIIMLGFIWLLACWLSLLHLRNAGGYLLLLYLLLLVWAADTGAYAAGQLWGRVKLAPLISPGKTLEGLLGGLVVATMVSTVFALIFQLSTWPLWAHWLLMAWVVALFSVIGDLTVSMLKRLAGVKDTGKLLPGHGGILDRIDSLLAASPVFILLFCL